VGGEIASALGATDLVAMAHHAGADGVEVDWRFADRRRLALAHRRHLDTRLFVVDGEARLQAFARWPVDGLMTGRPGDAP
jgi:hypothetical protein